MLFYFFCPSLRSQILLHLFHLALDQLQLLLLQDWENVLNDSLIDLLFFNEVLKKNVRHFIPVKVNLGDAAVASDSCLNWNPRERVILIVLNLTVFDRDLAQKSILLGVVNDAFQANARYVGPVQDDRLDG